MKPITTEHTRPLKGSGDIKDLPVLDGEDGALYSLWRLDLWERLRLLLGGVLSIGVLSDQHPPITVVVGIENVPYREHRHTIAGIPCWCGGDHGWRP